MISYIKSGSMEPTYYTGDLVIIAKVPPQEIKEGDVIVYRQPGGEDLILHRVVKIEERNGVLYFLTKGDNPKTNPYIDEWTSEGWIHESHVIGKLVSRIPYLGYIFIYLDAPGARFMLILILLLLLALSLMAEEKTLQPKFSILYMYLKRLRIRVLIVTIPLVLSILLLASSVNSGKHISIEITAAKSGESYYVGCRPYVVIRLRITSKISLVESITMLEIYINQDEIHGEGVWTIRYPFYGNKTVSIAILLDTPLPPDKLPEEFHATLKVHIKNFITGMHRVETRESDFQVNIIMGSS